MRRRYRITLALLATPVALTALLLAVLLALGNTEGGRRFIESSTARLSGGTVRLQGLAGRFPDQLRLAQLRLGDPQGVWLEVDDLQLRWSPLRLWSRQGQIELLQAARVSVARAPAYASRKQPRKSQGLWLRGLEIDRLEVARLELGAPLVGNPVAARVQGSARLSSLQQASLQLTAQRLDTVPATYRATAQIDPARVDATLTLQEGPGGPLAHLLRLPGLGALSVELRLNGPREAVDARLEAHAEALQAAVNGTLNLRDRAAQLAVTLAAPAMTLRPGLSWQRLSLQGQWSGALTAPSTTAHVDLAGLTIGPLQIEAMQADLHNQLQDRRQELVMDARVAGLLLPGLPSALLRGAPLGVHGELGLGDASWPMQFILSHPRFDAHGQIQFGAAAAGSASMQLHDLSPVAELIHLDLAGRASLQAKLSRAGTTMRIEISSELEVTGGTPLLAPLLAPRATLTGSLALREGTVELERSELVSPHLHAAAHGGDLRSALALSWTLSVPDLAALSSALAGNLNATGVVQGTRPRLTVAAQASGEVSTHGSALGAMQLRLGLHDLPEQPVGRIELSGMLDQAPLQLTAGAQRGADGVIAVQIERGDWKSAHAEGAIQLEGASHSPHGHFELRVARLEDLQRLLGQKLQGSAAANLDFKGQDSRNRAMVDVQVRDLAVASLQVPRLQLRGQIDQPTSHPTLALQLSASGESAGVSAELGAEARGVLDNLNLSAKLVTAGTPATAARLEAAATLHAGRRELRLTALTAHYRQQTLTLLDPVLVSYGDGLAVDRLRLRLAQALLLARGRLTPNLDLHLSLSNVTPALLRFELPELAGDGRVDAEVQLAGSLARPTGVVSVTGQGLRAHSGAARGLPATEFTVNAQLAGESAQLDVQLHAGEHLQLRLNGQAPLSRTGPMALQLHGNVALKLLNPILEARGQSLLGQTRIDAEIGGTPAAPSVHGTLTLTQGDLQDYPRGVRLRDINATLQADGTQLTLQQFSARAGSGTISATGSLDLGGEGLPLTLSVTAKNAQPLASDLLTANVDIDLKLAGTLRRELTASGQVRVNRADINIPNALPPSVDALKVVRAGEAPPPPPKSWTTVRLDLTVDAPRGVFVRGRGLDAELGGRLHIGGKNSAPDVSGGFDLRNGTVNLAGATLTFSSGTLSFNGTGVRHRIDPTLNFTATNVSPGVTSTLTIGGYADAPVISLSSVPEMPQDEILSRLLFGVSLTQLSPLQIAQIGAALASMSGIGGGGGFNPISAVQRKLRLDRLAISGGATTAAGAAGAASPAAQGPTGTTIEAGRYVTSRVFVGARQTTNGPTQAEVQVDLSKKLKLQTTLGTGGGMVQGTTPQNDPGSSVGIAYQFEY